MTHEVAIVGAGIVGAATAHALTREGVDVIVHEQFEVGHDRGSSHGRSRIFRLSYPEPEWVRLAQEALTGWRRLERETGERLLALSGLVEIVDDLGDASCAALDECGVPWRLLDAAEAECRHGLRLEAGSLAVLQEDAGVVFADRALRAFLRGVRVEDNSPVRDLGELDAKVVVVTAGSWAKELLAAAGIDLDVRVTRETVAYFRLAGERPVPSVAKLRPASGGHAFYGLHDPLYGLKLGSHRSGPQTHPDELGVPDPEMVGELSRWVAEWFPAADPEPAAADTCLYTSTLDERFVLERRGRIVVGSACSGHGFKFAPVVGERLARFALAALE